eukprot:scaffold2134_cov384-Prasinococcus_capsulatus_cf.AAC.19
MSTIPLKAAFAVKRARLRLERQRGQINRGARPSPWGRLWRRKRMAPPASPLRQRKPLRIRLRADPHCHRLPRRAAREGAAPSRN